MPGHVKVGGVWKAFTPKFRVGGAWKTATGGWVKVAGVWRKFYDPYSPIVVGATAFIINTNAGSKSVAITGETGSYLVAIGLATGNVVQPPTDSLGGTWTLITSRAASASPQRTLGVYVRTGALASAASVTVTHNVAAGDSGGGICVFRLDGADQTSGYAYVDNHGFETDPASGVPFCGFDSGAALATNCQIGAVLSVVGAPGTPAGWTQVTAGTYTVPTTLYGFYYRASGETATNITFGSNTATNWCSIMAEFKPVGV